MSVQQRRNHDPGFKRNAVLLSEEEGRTATEAAENLGISKDLLYRWRREYRSCENLTFPGHGKESLTEQERRIREIEKELQDTRIKRDIPKRSWPSSAKHRNGIHIHRRKTLWISGEEDVPGHGCFTERILSLVEKTEISKENRQA